MERISRLEEEVEEEEEEEEDVEALYRWLAVALLCPTSDVRRTPEYTFSQEVMQGSHRGHAGTSSS